MLRWVGWHLDRFSSKDAEMRFLDQATYLDRDGLNPGVRHGRRPARMDAMGLGWVVMRPEGNRPLIVQKAGGLAGHIQFRGHGADKGRRRVRIDQQIRLRRRHGHGSACQ